MNVISEFQPFKKNEYLNLNCLFTMGDISICKFNVVKLVVTNTTQGDRNIGGVMKWHNFSLLL